MVATYDGKKAEWSRCGYCEGFVGKEGRTVLHTEPACEAFLDVLREYGVEIENCKDVSKN